MGAIELKAIRGAKPRSFSSDHYHQIGMMG